MKRPTTYVEWRKALHSTAISIGFQIGSDWMYRHRVTIDRETWKLLHRYERIRRRLEAEFEAMDATCAQAVLDMVFDKRGEA